jgi:hypothetical protein
MNYQNGALQHWSLTSQYHGPLLHLDARKSAEEEAAEAEAAKAAEEAAAAEAAKAEEEAAAAAAAAEEDPLATPNPFEEGSAQHLAFENQREKFKQKLARETEAARKGAAGDLSGKLDELLTLLGTKAKPKEEETPKPPALAGSKATSEDIEIVKDALRQVGFDPEEAAKDKRRQQVNASITQLRATYPGVEFDDSELVKYANDSGISRLGGSVYDILELALIRKHKDAIRTAPVKPKVEPKTETKTEPAKKEPVPIQKTGTKPNPNPQETPSSFQGWKERILGKHRGK